MSIFDKRPLAFILSVMLFGFVGFASGEVWVRVICAFLIPLLLLLKFVLPSRSNVPLFASALLVLSIVLSYIYFDLWFYPEYRFSGEVEITAKISSIEQTENSNEVILKTTSIDDKAFTKYKLLTYLDNETVMLLSEGDTIKFICSVYDLGTVGFDNAESYYKPQGINGYAENIKNITVLKDGNPPIQNNFPHLREYLRRRAVMTSNDKTGTLAGALLFGERDMMDDNLRYSFKVIGITHILALSGMHLSILALGIGKLLELLNVSKKPRTVFVIIFTVIYMAFTGFASSVVRAGFMLIISSLLFLLSRSHDSITSLITSVFIIILISPYSAFDISLWLSAFATLGVISVGEYSPINENSSKNLFIRAISWIKLSLLSSLFAIMATSAFSAIIFEGYSVLSPISTLIFSPIVEVFMYTSTLQLIVGDFIPIGALSIKIGEFIYNLANSLASIDNIYLSTGFPSVYISAIACTVFFLVFLVVKINRKKFAVLSLTFIYLAFLCISYFENLSYISQDKFEHISHESCSDILINTNNERILVSSSSYNKNLAYDTANSISDLKYTRLDKFCLTHYSFNIPEYLDIILSRIDVDVIYLPEARNEKEDIILTRIAKVADVFECELNFYDKNGQVKFYSYSFELFYSSEYGSPARAAYTVFSTEYKFTYLSSGILDDNLYDQAMKHIEASDSVVFGDHGAKYKERIHLDYYTPKKQIIILNSENLFFTQDNLIYKEENGCEIYSHPSGKTKYISLIKR